MINNVSGHFRSFHIEAQTDGNDFSEASILVKANIADLSTNNETRDAHLKSKDFFDAEVFPELLFRSGKIEKDTTLNFVLHGDLTLKGTTKPIMLNVEFGGIAQDGQRNDKAGFTVTGKINRSDWGINFNRVLETGGLGLGEEVRISGEVQLLKLA